MSDDTAKIAFVPRVKPVDRHVGFMRALELARLHKPTGEIGELLERLIDAARKQGGG